MTRDEILAAKNQMDLIEAAKAARQYISVQGTKQLFINASPVGPGWDIYWLRTVFLKALEKRITELEEELRAMGVE